jgi:hypothetical protein
MKRPLLLIALLLSVSTLTFAQFTLGPKVGYTASKLSTDLEDIEEDARHNFQIGAFARFGKKFYVQPEIVYGNRGGVLIDEDVDGKQTIKFKNLDIPVLVGFKLLNLKVFNLRILGGPSASFVLDKTTEVDDIITDPVPIDSFKNVIWGVDLGIGADVFFLTLDIRYEWGLNDLYDAATGDTDYSMKDNLFIVSLGFKLF